MKIREIMDILTEYAEVSCLGMDTTVEVNVGDGEPVTFIVSLSLERPPIPNGDRVYINCE